MLGFTVIGLVLAGAYYFVSPRTYAATALVQVNALQTTENALGGRTSGPVNMDNENQIVQSASVAAIAKSQLKTPLSVADLLKEIKVTVPPNTTFLQITCSAATADLAWRCANAFGRSYLYNRRATALGLITSGISQLESQATALESSIEKLRAKLGSHGLPAGSATRGVAELELTAQLARLSTIQSKISSATPLEANLAAKNTAVGQIVTPAVSPATPATPKKKLVLPSGLAGGLALGLLVAFFVDWRRPRIYSARDVQRHVDVPVVFSLTDRPAAGGLAPPKSVAGQVFTDLAHYVGSALGDGSHVLLVTPAAAGPSSSGSGGVLAANLAGALARTRGETVLIRANPGGPVSPRLSGSSDGRGFAELLAGTAELAEVSRRTADVPQLSVIAPGLDGASAVCDMQHDKLQRIMPELRRDVRYVVIDVPPPTVDADAFGVAEFADAAIVAVPAGTTHPADLNDCLRRFERMRTAVLAAVLLPPTAGSTSGRSSRAKAFVDEPVPPAPRTRRSARSQRGGAGGHPPEPSQRGAPGGRPPEPAQRGAPGGRPPEPAQRGAPGGRPPGPAQGYAPPPWSMPRDEPDGPSQPVIRPVASRRHAAPGGWTPRSVSEVWPLPQAPLTEQDEGADAPDPLFGN